MEKHNFSNDSSLHLQAPMETGEMIGTLIPLCTIVFLVFFGNVLVIIAVFHRRSLRTPQNIYLVSLACVDLSLGIFILPLNIVNLVQRGWYLGVGLCKFYLTLNMALCALSILHLCCIALDRYQAITEGIHFIQRRTQNRVLVIIAAITVLSIWISSPPLLGWDKDWLNDLETTKSCSLSNSPGFVIYAASGSFLLPLIMMVSLYVLIFYALRDIIRKRAKVSLKKGSHENVTEESRSGNELDESDDSPTENLKKKINRQSEMVAVRISLPATSQQFRDFVAEKQKFSLKKERNAARTLGLILAAFIICWLPFTLMYIIVPFCCSYPSTATYQTFLWLGYINAGLNPLIYPVSNLEFRKEFKVLLRLSS